MWLWPWSGMDRKLLGRRSGELVLHTAGSGIGKTKIISHLMYRDLMYCLKVGAVMLEQTADETINQLVAIHLKKPVHLIVGARKVNEMRIAAGYEPYVFDIIDDLTDEEYEGARDFILQKKNLKLYDHWGSIEGNTVIDNIDYLITAMGCRQIYLDHISIVVSGQAVDERKAIDVLMTELRSLTVRTDCRVDAVCHLRKADGKAYEEGGRVTLGDLRGSGGLAHLSNVVIGYERNQQDADPLMASTLVVRSLKDRFGGFTGIATVLYYDEKVGQLVELPWQPDGEGGVVPDFSSVNTDLGDIFPCSD